MQKLDMLEQRLGDLSIAMTKQVTGVTETNNLLRDNSVPRQTAEQFMGHIKVLATTATENRSDLAALLPALSGVSQKLNSFSEILLQQREQMQQTMLNTAESQDMIRNALTSLVEEENEIHNGMLSEITQLRKFMLEMQPVSSQMVPLLTGISSRLNEQSVASNNQQEAVRLMTQSVTQTFGGLKSSIDQVLQDAERNRRLHSELSGQLMNSQRAIEEFGNLQQSLAKVAEVLSNSVTTSKVLVEEVGNMRGLLVDDLRYEIQEALQQQEMEDEDPPPVSRENKPSKPKSK